jgi:hypothetical protein
VGGAGYGILLRSENVFPTTRVRIFFLSQ